MRVPSPPEVCPSGSQTSHKHCQVFNPRSLSFMMSLEGNTEHWTIINEQQSRIYPFLIQVRRVVWRMCANHWAIVVLMPFFYMNLFLLLVWFAAASIIQQDLWAQHGVILPGSCSISLENWSFAVLFHLRTLLSNPQAASKHTVYFCLNQPLNIFPCFIEIIEDFSQLQVIKRKKKVKASPACTYPNACLYEQVHVPVYVISKIQQEGEKVWVQLLHSLSRSEVLD